MHCHTNNRGDEAAVHALVDELNLCYEKPEIVLAMRGESPYPNMPENVRSIRQYTPGNFRAVALTKLASLTKGRILASGGMKRFVQEIIEADIVLHAPGGPSIGDTYYEDETSYLYVYDLVRALGKRYMFYAPSMGPFNRKERNGWRKKVLKNADALVLRDPLSARYVKGLLPDMEIYQTLDSALQHDLDMDEYKDKLKSYAELVQFLNKNKKCVGITITDLTWHPIHSKKPETKENIRHCFWQFFGELVNKGYGVILIPQLYGGGNDYDLMKAYMSDAEHFFIIPADDERYDAYFQQYVISQLYAVVGMRYHSNIFSAKMGTPFISVSYEQKMQGFMKKMNLSKYCLRLDDLSTGALQEKFSLLETEYSLYKEYLIFKHNEMKKESYKTTVILKEIINELKRIRNSCQ